MATTATSVPLQSPLNATDDTTQTLQGFSLLDLEQFTLEGRYSPTSSNDFHQFYVGRDNVHDILKYVLSRVRVSLYLNMFGFDDDELNDILMQKAKDPNVAMLITLDRSQAGGMHEKALLDADQQISLSGLNTHFVSGISSTHQFGQTKGFVADSVVGGQGSPNWSRSGEGTFSVVGSSGRPGSMGQTNIHTIFTSPDAIARFQAELITEHMAAQNEPWKRPPNKKR